MRQLILHRAALQHNLHQVRLCAPHSKVLAMVKANAYGHGLTWAAEVLADADVDGLGVAILDEALQLRAAGFEGVIVIADGVQSLAELEEACAARCAVVIHQERELAWVEQLRHALPLSVWLKVDTGMHRLGFAPSAVIQAYQRLMHLDYVQKPIVLMTHFSDADDTEKDKTPRQIALYQQVYNQLSPKPLRSLANSASIVAWPETHGDWVRPGIILYGGLMMNGQPTAPHLQPVMTVKSQIISIHDYPAGAPLGYGETFICPKPMRVGVVAFGYGDGYPRRAYQSEVLIRGHIIPAIARISMDMLQVDLTDHPPIQLNDEVTLLGEGLPAWKLAQVAQTIPYEIFCQLQHGRLHVKMD